MKIVPYREYSPFSEMSRMLDGMRDLMNRSLASDALWQDQPDYIYRLALDITQDDDSVTVQATVPGMSEDNIDIAYNEGVLTISAESQNQRDEQESGWHMRELRYGRFARAVRLPAEVDIDRASAELENGILTITLPKVQPAPAHKIAVRAKKLLTGNKE